MRRFNRYSSSRLMTFCASTTSSKSPRTFAHSSSLARIPATSPTKRTLNHCGISAASPSKQLLAPCLSPVWSIFPRSSKRRRDGRFAKRYLKATHCDLFFADGAVLVEGPAERILVPHFVRTRSKYDFLKRCYVTWLEIGGSHAHRLSSLIEHLGLNTLINHRHRCKGCSRQGYSPAARRQRSRRGTRR